jgi:hypothetical protein
MPGYDPYLMTAVFAGTGEVLLRNQYTNGAQVSEQTLANGDVYRYRYVFAKDEIVETILNGPNGENRFFFQHGVLR